MLPISFVVVVLVWLLNAFIRSKALLAFNIPDANIIINPDRGFILQKIGTYSSDIETAIIHTFVPIQKVCDASQSTDKCVRISKSKSMQLATVSSMPMINRLNHLLNNHNISLSIESSIKKMLSIHGNGGFLPHLKSNFHFFEGDFYVPETDELIKDNQSEAGGFNDPAQINQDIANTVPILLEQFRGHRTGFDFLTQVERLAIIKPVLCALDESYNQADHNQLIDDFNQVIVSQSLHAFRSCSMREENYLSPPCLIISTVFVRPLRPTIDACTVYQLHAIPIMTDDHRYEYTNVPNIFGCNSIRNKMVTWHHESQKLKCLFIKTVLCFETPVPSPMSDELCLRALLSNQVTDILSCDVIRTRTARHRLQNIIRNIWVFNDPDANNRSELSDHYDLTHEKTENFTAVFIQSCNQTIKSLRHKRASPTCDDDSTVIFSTNRNAYEKLSTRKISLQNLTSKLVRTYWRNSDRIFAEIEILRTANESTIQRIWKTTGHDAMHAFLLAILFFLIAVATFFRRRCQTRLHNLERGISNLNDIILE